MMEKKSLSIAFTALLTALCCVATLVIRIPTPAGYINPGDALVLLSSFMLGPFLGAAASGIGSALADLFSGYLIFAPATLIIKAAMALIAGLINKALGKKFSLVALVTAGLAAELIMILGYFVYESTLLGFGPGAAEEILPNCAQGLFGIIAGSALYLALRGKTKTR